MPESPRSLKPVAAPDTPLDHAAMFPELEWIYDPISRTAIARSALRPCSCGSTRFVYIARGSGTSDFHVYCEQCRAVPRFHMARKGDLVYARLDVATGLVTYSMSHDDIRRRVAAMARAKEAR